jgi:hypothetical protein
MLRRADAGREPSASPFWKSSSSLDAERLKPRCCVGGLVAKPCAGRPFPLPGVVGESWSDMDIMVRCSSCRLLRAAAPISLSEVVLKLALRRSRVAGSETKEFWRAVTFSRTEGDARQLSGSHVRPGFPSAIATTPAREDAGSSTCRMPRANGGLSTAAECDLVDSPIMTLQSRSSSLFRLRDSACSRCELRPPG